MYEIPKKIQAAVLLNTNRPLEILSLSVPKLKKGQVLVKILYSGVCRSQLMECRGNRGIDKWLPHMMGHEGYGIVIDVGPGVKKVSIADEVILTWIKCDGIDAEPARYKNKSTYINSGKVTTFSNFSIVSENRTIKKPKRMPEKVASLYGCAFPTGAGMVLNDIKFKKNNFILILGLGGIGMSSLIALRAMGHENIIVLDTSNKKLKIASKMGVKFTLNAKSKFKEKLYKITGNGVDYCIESAGTTQSIELGFNLINDAGTLLFASHPKNEEKIQLFPHDLIRGKKIFGSWGGGVKPDIDIQKIYNLFQKFSVPYNDLIKTSYSLRDINTALNDLEKGKVFRPIIKMEHK